MLIIDCETWRLSVVLVSIVIVVTVLLLAMIKLLRVLGCPKHRRLSYRKCLSGGNTWKTMAIRVFKNKPKSCMVAMATYMRANWWNWTFLNGKKHRKNSHKAVTPKSKLFWRYAVILVRGAHLCPPAWIGLTTDFEHLQRGLLTS